MLQSKIFIAAHLIKVILASHTAAALHKFQKEPVVEMYLTLGIPNSIEEKEYCPHWLCVVLSAPVSFLAVSVLRKQPQVSVFWTKPFASALQS
jgi:hypothetical protein